MKELFRRLFHSKRLATEILVASLFVNILFLASPIYVIQILSRYIGYGFDGTLYTLTAGMLIALVLGVAFNIIRTRMCAVVSIEPDQDIQSRVLESLSSIKSVILERIPQARLQEIMAAPQVVQNAYEASRIVSVLDMPFFLLFVLAIFFLSPMLAVITLLAVGASFSAGILSMKRVRKADRLLHEEFICHRGSVTSAIHGQETVRLYGGQNFLRRIWEEQVLSLFRLKGLVAIKKNWSIALAQGLASLLKVAVYAVGAREVVMGDMTVGSLIGVSIMSAKALQISSSFIQTVQLMGHSDEAMKMINEFTALPHDSSAGTALKRYSGKLEFKDVSMAFPNATGPLFEALNCLVEPGAVVGVLGNNGAGKTTLTKMLAGLLEPVRGQLLADGVELRQLSLEWWRKQIMYLPQEPTFLNGTYRENIVMNRPDVDVQILNRIVAESDLRRFLDASAKGIETSLSEGGRNLPLGVRKRLALARALVSQGRLAVFDEPTEGLDVEGREAVIGVMKRLIHEGVTLVVVSRDPNVMKEFTIVIDLNSKPVPKVGIVRKQNTGSELFDASKG